MSKSTTLSPLSSILLIIRSPGLNSEVSETRIEGEHLIKSIGPCVPYEYSGKEKSGGFWSGTQYVNSISDVRFMLSSSYACLNMFI